MLEYDADGYALSIRLKRGKVAESELISDNLILDLNRKGEINGMEVLGPKPIDVTRFLPPVNVITKKQ